MRLARVPHRRLAYCTVSVCKHGIELFSPRKKNTKLWSHDNDEWCFESIWDARQNEARAKADEHWIKFRDFISVDRLVVRDDWRSLWSHWYLTSSAIKRFYVNFLPRHDKRSGENLIYARLILQCFRRWSIVCDDAARRYTSPNKPIYPNNLCIYLSFRQCELILSAPPCSAADSTQSSNFFSPW